MKCALLILTLFYNEVVIMKNKKWKQVLTIMLTSILLTGCGTPEVNKPLPEEAISKEKEELLIDMVPEEMPDDPTQAPINGITVNPISFEVLDETLLSDQIQKDIESLKLVRGYHYWLQDDGSYIILISSGEKTTGSYGIEITSIEDNEGKTNISVVETSPSADVMVIQVISYPHIVIQVSGITDQFNIINQDQVTFDICDVEYDQ